MLHPRFGGKCGAPSVQKSDTWPPERRLARDRGSNRVHQYSTKVPKISYENLGFVNEAAGLPCARKDVCSYSTWFRTSKVRKFKLLVFGTKPNYYGHSR